MENSKVRIFGHPWHLAHQYELLKFPWAEWSWLIQFNRPYSPQARGDFQTNWVPDYEPGKYDLAVLHLDQQCIEEQIFMRGKGRLYRELNEVIQDIPKIVIFHGTTYYPEKFTKEEVILKVKNLVGNNTVVMNSKQAVKDFGFGIPIWHGMDPAEWLDLPKEPRVITTVSPAGLDMYYDRMFMETIREELELRGIMHCHVTVDWKARDWEDYRNFIGRSLVFLAPFFDSPMPRSRTEAMLSGCAVITTPYQDADQFIKDGENGVIIPKRDPVWVADKIVSMIENYQDTLKLGQAGKQTAIETFSVERYQNDWKELVQKVLGKTI